MFGFLNINKPPGPTSHDIVYTVRKRVGRGVKVGHAGTLDPFAQGVLVVCLGGACRLADLVMGQTKRYRTTIILGATSDTDDCTGRITTMPVASLSAQAVADVLPQFVGEIQQVPPSHSAIFVQGRRAYKIARKGEELALPPRAVEVHSIELLSYEPAPPPSIAATTGTVPNDGTAPLPQLTIEIACGSGTYIRALARDIGKALGVGGYCQELTRLASGDFTIESAVSPTELDPQRDLVSPLVAVAHMSKVAIAPEQLPHLLLGRRLPLPEPMTPGEVAIVDSSGSLLALGRVSEGGQSVHPNKVLVERKL